MTEDRRRILVSPEHADCIPLWNRCHHRSDGFVPEEAGISAGLLDRLRDWNLAWQAANPPERANPCWSPLEAERWKHLGYRLARQLQAELPDVEIVVQDDHGHEVPVSPDWQ